MTPGFSPDFGDQRPGDSYNGYQFSGAAARAMTRFDPDTSWQKVAP